MTRRRQFGSIRKLASGRYQARYQDSFGTTHTAPETFARRADAANYLALIEADMSRGSWHDPRLGKTPFREWAARFMATKADLKPKTRYMYDGVLRSRILPVFGDHKVDSIRSIDVRAWMSDLAAAGLSAARRRHCLGLLDQIMRAAVADRLIAVNPCAGIVRPAVQAREQDYLTMEEVDRLAGEMPVPYDLLVYVLACGGLRWGEAVALRRRHCDLLHSELVVLESLAETNELHWGDTKTHQRRKAVIPGFLRDRLAEHLAANVDVNPDALVFTTPSGTPLRYSNFYRKVWMPAMQRAGLGHRGTHIGRHTAATLLLAAGADVKDVQAQLGHKDATMTLNIYAAPFEGKRQHLAARIDAAWEVIRNAANGPPETAIFREMPRALLARQWHDG
jgi:integrase